MSGFQLISPEFFDLAWLDRTHEFNGLDGIGENRSPAFQWSGAPAGTQSYAFTLYDPDAPTGSGFWHWVAYDIPAEAHGLVQGAGSSGKLELRGAAGLQAANDFGAAGYGGPCPPRGGPPHRYLFTLHALGIAQLGVSPETPNAVVRYVVHQNTLSTARLTAHYKR